MTNTGPGGNTPNVLHTNQKHPLQGRLLSKLLRIQLNSLCTFNWLWDWMDRSNLIKSDQREAHFAALLL